MTKENDSGLIVNASKGKGYESLSRNMLQDTNLSLEAIGLLANIQSYPDNWKLYKTELYRRFPKNKRKSIDRIWDELVRNGYIVQFRRRVGRQYIYKYIMSSEKYFKNDIIEIIKSEEEIGFLFYHKDMLKSEDMKSIDPLDYIQLSEIDNWTVQNEHSNKDSDTNDSSTVPFGQSKVSSSKGTPSRSITKRSTINSLDDDDNIYKDEYTQEISKLEKLNTFISDREDFKVLSQMLFESSVELEDISDIIEYFHFNNDKFKIDVIRQQLKWMKQKTNEGVGISSFSKYFINGIEGRVKTGDMSDNFDVEEEFYSRLNIDRNLPKVPLINWLNEDGGV